MATSNLKGLHGDVLRPIKLGLNVDASGTRVTCTIGLDSFFFFLKHKREKHLQLSGQDEHDINHGASGAALPFIFARMKHLSRVLWS